MTTQFLQRLLCGALLTMAAALVAAQNAATSLPSNYQVVFNNADARVLHAHYGPHEKVPVHDHPAYPTVFVYLNDSGVVRLSHVDGGAVSVVNRPPTHTGAFRVAPGKLERHAVENLGDAPADSVLVELKSLPHEAITEEFRGPAPAQPLLTNTATVYSNSAARVERLICDPGATCTLNATAAPSVLIAVTPTVLVGGAKGEMLTLDQPASWLPAGAREGMRSMGSVPAQLLRIVLLTH